MSAISKLIAKWSERIGGGTISTFSRSGGSVVRRRSIMDPARCVGDAINWCSPFRRQLVLKADSLDSVSEIFAEDQSKFGRLKSPAIMTGWSHWQHALMTLLH